MPRRSTPKLNKRRVATHRGYDVVTVNSFAVRDLTRTDEEFTNFATHGDFPELIGLREIWVEERLYENEGVFYLANALMRLEVLGRGGSDDTSYTAGLNLERILRERLVGVKYRAGRPHRRVPRRIYAGPYVTVDDPKSPIRVWSVDGNLVRCFYKTDYTEGGHGYVYPWVPKGEIWVERDLEASELPYVVAHEYLELRLMRDEGLEYDRAHATCSKVEFSLRERGPVLATLGPEGRNLRKSDLGRLASPEFFDYVVKRFKVR